MKKIFTLLAVLIASVGIASAEVYEWYTLKSKTETQTPAGSNFFSVNKGEGTAAAWSSKGKHKGTYVTVDGKTLECADAVKMESTTQLVFTTTKPSNVIFVQTTSNKAGDFLKFDGVNQTGVANPSQGDVTVQVYTLSNVAAGEHKITRVSETGLMYVRVEEIETGLNQLTAPLISYDKESGLVTITQAENSEVRYTVDGKAPTAESTLYEAPFTVEDNTVVKAVAIGDNVTTENSLASTETVLLTGFQVATPEIKAINGTFYVTCATALATIEYSTDNTTWNPFTRAITVAENTTVSARATRENCTTSEVASAEVAVLPAVESTKTIYMGWGSFEVTTAADETTCTVLTGKAKDAAEGITLTCGTVNKSYSNGVTIDMNGEVRTAIKLSNGAANTLKLPEGISATRITIYSYQNVPALARVAYWREIIADGVALDVVNDIPMGALNNGNADPDVRVYNLDNAKEITFTNAGEQLFFTIALDVVSDELPTLSDPWHSNGVDLNGNPLNHVYTIGEQVLLNHALGKDVIYYTLDGNDPVPANAEVAAPAAAPARAAAVDAEDHTGKTYKLTERPIIYDGNPLTISYIAHKEGFNPSAIQKLDIFDNGTTGIESIGVDAQEGAVEYFNLQGVRVENPSNGIYIRRQGNTVTKVIVK